MNRSKRVSFTLAAGSTSNIAASQTPGAAGNLTLNGALASGGVIPDLLLGYIVSFTSAGDVSNRTFLITGTDPDGKAQTETVTGPNANTVVSTKFFRTIATIAISGAAAAALTAGTPNTTKCAATPTYCLDLYEPACSTYIDIGGTINYDLQKCGERPTAGEVPNWVAGGLTGQTVDANTSYQVPTGAVRGLINSYTNGATIAMSILQSRMNG